MDKKVKEKKGESPKRKEVFTPSERVEALIVEFKSKENPSENVLVIIQHLESVQKLLEKDALALEVVDSEEVK